MVLDLEIYFFFKKTNKKAPKNSKAPKTSFFKTYFIRKYFLKNLFDPIFLF